MSDRGQSGPKPQGYEPCEECGAPLDPQQRYCVKCAARRGNGSNPSSRYFAAMSKKARRLADQRPGRAGGGSRAAAVGFFALLPIAVALGVVVGRSGSSDWNEEALLRALQRRKRPQVAAAPAEEEPPRPRRRRKPATPKTQPKTAKNGKKPRKRRRKKPKKTPAKSSNKTKNGIVHEVTGYKPTKATEEADTKMVEENPEQTGENYIKAQQNLPDVTVVGGEGKPASDRSSTPGVEP